MAVTFIYSHFAPRVYTIHTTVHFHGTSVYSSRNVDGAYNHAVELGPVRSVKVTAVFRRLQCTVSDAALGHLKIRLEKIEHAYWLQAWYISLPLL